MLALICAMHQEAMRLISNMDSAERVHEGVDGSALFDGELFGKRTIICISNPGKVNAAISTVRMLERYGKEITAVVNIGVSGGLEEYLSVGDIVVVSGSVQSDNDTTALKDPPGWISGMNVAYIDSDIILTSAVCSAFKKQMITYEKGVCATADMFTSARKHKELLKKIFNASVCDMESGAIAQACYMYKKPFVAVKLISDTLNGVSEREYLEYSDKMPDDIFKAVLAFHKQVI